MEIKEILKVFGVKSNTIAFGTKDEMQNFIDKVSRYFKPCLVRISYKNDEPRTIKITNLSIIENPSRLGDRKYLLVLMTDNGYYEILLNNKIESISKISTPKYKYFLVDAGYNPKTDTQWYDLIKAKDWDEATKISESKKYGAVIEELSNNFRQAIGELIYDYMYPTYAIKPIALKDPS